MYTSHLYVPFVILVRDLDADRPSVDPFTSMPHPSLIAGLSRNTSSQILDEFAQI